MKLRKQEVIYMIRLVLVGYRIIKQIKRGKSMNLKNKRIILTGGSSGIGLELLDLLDEKGARILAIGLEEFDPKLSSVTYIQEDISTKEGVDKIFEKSIKILGGIDIFIANAGFTYYEGSEKADWEKTKIIFDTNVSSPIYAFHRLKKIKANKPFQFVVTASAISYMPLAGYALYSGTKHALKGFFEAARYELPKHQVITIIYPISTKTNFFKKNMPIPFPAHKACTVAKYYIRGIEKNKRRIFTSKFFYLDTYFNIIQPLIQRRESRQFKLWRKKYQ